MASEMAAIHENIIEFKEKYLTKVGERGVTLSEVKNNEYQLQEHLLGIHVFLFLTTAYQLLTQKQKIIF